LEPFENLLHNKQEIYSKTTYIRQILAF